MADKSKIQVEIETILSKEQNSVENALNKIKSQFASLQNLKFDLGGGFGTLKTKINEAENALKPFISLFERASKLSTTSANAFSQIFTKQDVERFKQAQQLLQQVQNQASPLTSAYKSFQKELLVQAEETNKKLTASGGFNWVTSSATKESRKELELLNKQYKQLEATASSSKGFLHLNEGLKGYISGVKELLAFQARWYAARGVLFTALQMPVEAIKSNLELGKAVKQAGAAADMTAQQIEQLRQKAVAISNEVPISAEKIAQSAFIFAQSGMDFTTITEAMPLAAKMVVTTGEDMKVAVDALTVAFFGWKLQAKDLPKTADMITAAMAASRMQVADLGTVFNYLATTAKTLNVSLDGLTSIKDTLTISSVLSQAGVKASTIGTGLSNAITRLVKASKDENDKLAKILSGSGINLSKVDPTKNRLIDIFKELSNAPELTLADVFSGWELRAGRTIAAILNQGSKAIDDMSKRIEEQGVMSRMFKTSTSNVLDQLTILENKFKNIFQIGPDAESGFVGFIKILQTMVDLIIRFRTELLIAASVFAAIKLSNSILANIEALNSHFSKLLEKIIKTEAGLTSLRTTLGILGRTTVVIGIAFSIMYILKGIMEKTMADEASKFSEFAKTLTDKEIADLNAMAKDLSENKWLDTKVKTQEGSVLDKLEKAKLGRMGQKAILQGLADYNKLKSAAIEVPKEPDVDRSGGKHTTKTSTKTYESRDYSIFKKNLQERLEAITLNYKDIDAATDSQHKRGLYSDEQYYTRLIELSKDREQEKLDVLITSQNKLLDVKKGGLKYQLEQDLKAASKDPEKQRQLKEQYNNQLSEVKNEITKITAEEYKLRLQAEDSLTQALAKKWHDRYIKKLDIEKDNLETISKLKDIEVDIQSSETSYDFERGLISREQYYAIERIKIKEDLKRKLIDIEADTENELARIRAGYIQNMPESGFTSEQSENWDIDTGKVKNSGANKKRIAEAEANKNLLNSMQELKKATKDVDSAFDELRSKWTALEDIGYDLTMGMANGLKDGITSVFEDLRNNELKSFEDYFKSFASKIAAVWDNMVAEMVVKWLFGIENMKGSVGGGDNSIMKGVIGSIVKAIFGMSDIGSSWTGSGADTGTGSSIWDVGTTSHFGGTIGVRKFHSGGLNSDERVVINKVGERYITKEQNAWLNSIASVVGNKDSSKESGNYNITIVANDAKSFTDMLNRNPNAIVKIVDSSLKNNTDFRKTVKRTTR